MICIFFFFHKFFWKYFNFTIFFLLFTQQSKGVKQQQPQRQQQEQVPQQIVAAPADTSSEAAKKYKERFRKETSEVVVRTLDPYHKVEATTGRIKNKEDFKYLAKKVSLRFFSINFHSPPMVPPLCMDYGNNRIRGDP